MSKGTKVFENILFEHFLFKTEIFRQASIQNRNFSTKFRKISIKQKFSKIFY